MTQYGPYGPYPPYPSYQPPPPWDGPPPAAVRYARNLIYALVGLALVRFALYWILTDEPLELPQSLAERGAADAVTIAFAAFLAIEVLLGAAIWVVAAVFIMRSANWARILVLGLCAYAAFSLLWTLASESLADPGDRLATELIVLDVITAVLVAIATVLLWIRESSRYFKSSGPPHDRRASHSSRVSR
jgi:hypothetical protein